MVKEIKVQPRRVETTDLPPKGIEVTITSPYLDSGLNDDHLRQVLKLVGQPDRPNFDLSSQQGATAFINCLRRFGVESDHQNWLVEQVGEGTVLTTRLHYLGVPFAAVLSSENKLWLVGCPNEPNHYA